MASSSQTTVTSTAVLIIESYGEFRDVSTSNGFVIPKDAYINFRVAPKSTIYAVCANNETGIASVLYMEP